MKKLSVYTLIIGGALILNVAIYYSIFTISEQAGQTNLTINTENIIEKTAAVPRKFLAFNYSINTEMLDQQQKILTKSLFHGKIALKKQDESRG